MASPQGSLSRSSIGSMTFSELGLSVEVLRGVEEAGYTEPTPIQQKSIPSVLQGRDVMGCAQTGTGKTGAFTLPLIDILASGRARARMPRALILEPTRELADQVDEAFAVYAKYQTKLSSALLIGGVSMDEQSRKLERGADVLIATPGRLLDHVERGQVVLRGIQMLVIDETDRMLDMGFIPDVQKIVRLLPAKRQTLFFSATLSPEIRRIGAEFVTDPKEISVSAPSSASVLVEQGLLQTTPSGKRDALRRLLEVKGVQNALIFLNRKKDVDVLATSLKRHGFAAAAIHGDLAQSVRMQTLESFKNGEIKFLVASDVAARGLDISALPFVINYDVPNHPEDYVHRIGRTARAGLKGTAFTLAVPEDSKSLAAIYKLIGKAIPAISLDGSAPAADTPQETPAEAEKPRPSRGSRNRGRSASGGRASGPSSAKPDLGPSEKSSEEPKPASFGAPEETKGEDSPRTARPRARSRSAKPRPAKSTETPKTPNEKSKPDRGDAAASVKDGSAASVKDGSAASVKDGSAASVKDGSAASIKDGSAASIKDGSAASIKDGSAASIKDGSAASIKDGSAAMGGHVPAFLLRPGHTDGS